VTRYRSRWIIAHLLITVVAAGRLEAGEVQEGEHVIVEHPKERLRIPDEELPVLKRRAKAGDAEAALRLATYYGFFLDNREKRNRELQVHYYHVAATHGSETGIENLIFTYSMDTDRFDMSKACHWRRELKRLAAQRNIQIQSDAEWYYDLYSEYFVARRSVESKRYKKLGLQFLECAAKLGLKEAERELTEISSDDPEVREEGKGIGPCVCGESPPELGSAPSPKSTINNAEDKLKVVSMNDDLRISSDELAILKRKAARGDHEAALKLATYYGIYLNDTTKELHYLKIGAKNNSDVAIRNLMTIYSNDSELFDFTKALLWRGRLKELARKKRVEIESDAQWGYDLYLNHLSDKDRGLFFLKYAAKYGSAEARRELSDTFGIER
jgi:hypothetical protein